MFCSMINTTYISSKDMIKKIQLLKIKRQLDLIEI